MNKKIGKKELNPEVTGNLKGFEDIFEDYVKSEEFRDNMSFNISLNKKTTDSVDWNLFSQKKSRSR